jgi:hypothetical protein
MTSGTSSGSGVFYRMHTLIPLNVTEAFAWSTCMIKEFACADEARNSVPEEEDGLLFGFFASRRLMYLIIANDTYGEKYPFTQTDILQWFTKVTELVGHYNSALQKQVIETFGTVPLKRNNRQSEETLPLPEAYQTLWYLRRLGETYKAKSFFQSNTNSE